MSYVGTPFERDIFVSYSHGADAHGDPMLQNWSLAFAKALREELRAESPYRDRLSMFIDAGGEPGESIDRALPLTEQLERQVKSSALLMVLVSPDYQASAWCADERRWWLQRQAASGLAAQGRIELVNIWPVQAQGWPGDQRWPAELADSAGHPLLGHRFHDNAKVGPRPLGWTQWRRREGFAAEVLDAVLELARVLYGRLDDLHDKAERLRILAQDAQRLANVVALTAQRQVHTTPADADPLTLYLHGRVEQQGDWQRVWSELQDGGFEVLPTALEPAGREPALREQQREQRVEEIARSDALLVLGTPAAPLLDADLSQIAKSDRQSAKDRCQRLLPCALLNTAGAPLDTPNRRRNASILKAEWLDAYQQPVVPVVQRWLLASGGSASGGSTNGGSASSVLASGGSAGG